MEVEFPFMSHIVRSTIAPSLALAALLSAATGAVTQDPPTPARRVETAESPDGTKLTGRLVSEAVAGVRFAPDGGKPSLPWDRIGQIRVDGPGPKGSTGPAPFQVLLGSGHRLSGRLIGLNKSSVRIDPGSGRAEWKVDRAGVTGVVQRPGEIQVFRDGFEALDPARWSRIGTPEPRADRKFSGDRALGLPAGGASITTRLPEPLPSGRVEIAFWDDGQKVAGQRSFIDLTFRKPDSELATLRVVVGWADETLAVETPGGPALTVQPLVRKAGWHRLSARFDAERASVGIDGDDLAHGRGIGGPLIEVRVATETTGAVQPPAGLSATVDDLRIVRLVEPMGRFEVDPTQDEIRLASGDQIFGDVESADGESLRFRIDGHPTRTTWAEVAGVFPKRASACSAQLGGVWAEVEWRTESGDDPRDLDRVEGVVSGLDDNAMTLEVPYIGRVLVPRDAIVRVSPRGQGARIVIDARSRHLGDRVSATLDPPQAEAAPVELSFTLTVAPPGLATLLVDASEVIGEEGSGEYIDLVKDGQLRTSVSINGRKLDDLNHFVSSRPDSPQRLRVPIPAGILKTGANVLRIDQAGTKKEPKLRDNLGISRIAIEFDQRAAKGGAN